MSVLNLPTKLLQSPLTDAKVEFLLYLIDVYQLGRPEAQAYFLRKHNQVLSWKTTRIDFDRDLMSLCISNAILYGYTVLFQKLLSLPRGLCPGEVGVQLKDYHLYTAITTGNLILTQEVMRAEHELMATDEFEYRLL